MEENLNFGKSHTELFDKWDDIISKVKDKKLGEVNEKELYEAKSETREFVSEVGKELKKLKEEGSGEFEPSIDPDKVAKEAGEKKRPEVDEEEVKEKEE